MTIEQKAKRYDEALWKAGELYQPSDSALLEEIFPELIRRNDEKVRGAIIHFISHTPTVPKGRINKETMLTWLKKQGEPKPTLPKWKYKNDNMPLLRDSIILNKYGCVSKSPSGALVSDVWIIDYDELAKLPKEENEKQDEQKSKNESTDTCDSLIIKSKEFPTTEKQDFGYFNKVEPKFKVGDIVKDPYGDVYNIIEINNDSYKTDDGRFILFKNEDAYRLWAMQDANKGDVLACDKCILIFDQLSEFNNEQVLMDICHCTPKGFYWQDTKDRDVWALDGFKPATKEQRDILFAKMHEAGFEWDAEKKELKIIDWNKHIKYEPNSPSIIEENPTWSDEDEETILKMMFTFRTRVFPSSEECISFIDFLKSLKNKVQPKQEWSEEDALRLEEVICMVEANGRWVRSDDAVKLNLDWLKSIKQRMG